MAPKKNHTSNLCIYIISKNEFLAGNFFSNILFGLTIKKNLLSVSYIGYLTHRTVVLFKFLRVFFYIWWHAIHQLLLYFIHSNHHWALMLFLLLELLLLLLILNHKYNTLWWLWWWWCECVCVFFLNRLFV